MFSTEVKSSNAEGNTDLYWVKVLELLYSLVEFFKILCLSYLGTAKNGLKNE